MNNNEDLVKPGRTVIAYAGEGGIGMEVKGTLKELRDDDNYLVLGNAVTTIYFGVEENSIKS